MNSNKLCCLLDLQKELNGRIATVPLFKLKEILANYQSTDWEKFVHFKDGVYHRELVCCNNNYKIIIISWKKGIASGIHDHPTKGCLMKVLKGNLIEIRYKKQNEIMQKTSTSLLTTDEISFIEGSDGLHNIYAAEDSVSLHIYSPPDYVPNFFL